MKRKPTKKPPAAPVTVHPHERVAALTGKARMRFFHTLGVDFTDHEPRCRTPDADYVRRAIAGITQAMQHATIASAMLSQPFEDPDLYGWDWADDVPAKIALAHAMHLLDNLDDLLRACLRAGTNVDSQFPYVVVSPPAPPPDVPTPTPTPVESPIAVGDVVTYRTRHPRDELLHEGGTVVTREGDVCLVREDAGHVDAWDVSELNQIVSHRAAIHAEVRRGFSLDRPQPILVPYLTADAQQEDDWPAGEIAASLHDLMNDVIAFNDAALRLVDEVNDPAGATYIDQFQRDRMLSMLDATMREAGELVASGIGQRTYGTLEQAIAIRGGAK